VAVPLAHCGRTDEGESKGLPHSVPYTPSGRHLTFFNRSRQYVFCLRCWATVVERGPARVRNGGHRCLPDCHVELPDDGGKQASAFGAHPPQPYFAAHVQGYR
jgi:hypothetical protein